MASYSRFARGPRILRENDYNAEAADFGGVFLKHGLQREMVGETWGYLEGYRGVDDPRFGLRVYRDRAHFPCFSCALDVPSEGVDAPPVGIPDTRCPRPR